MAIAKRVFLFIALNFLIIITLSVLANLLGIRPYLTYQGIDYEQLAAFCLLWGMGGAFISLALSRIMAKWMMGVQVIDPRTTDPDLQQLVQTVHALARGAGLPAMPEVGIYDSPELNAFATGPSRSRSLVAVSTGLLRRMSATEVEGVLGHEIAHVANGDMVTMTLLQGTVNAFVMFLSRIVAFALSQALRSRDDDRDHSPGFAYYIAQFLLEIVFMILGSMLVAWFSRYREYRADAGGARLAGRDSMVRALQALKRNYEIVDPNPTPATDTLKISGHPRGLLALFASHPPLDERIARLEGAV